MARSNPAGRAQSVSDRPSNISPPCGSAEISSPPWQGASLARWSLGSMASKSALAASVLILCLFPDDLSPERHCIRGCAADPLACAVRQVLSRVPAYRFASDCGTFEKNVVRAFAIVDKVSEMRSSINSQRAPKRPASLGLSHDDQELSNLIG